MYVLEYLVQVHDSQKLVTTQPNTVFRGCGRINCAAVARVLGPAVGNMSVVLSSR